MNRPLWFLALSTPVLGLACADSAPDDNGNIGSGGTGTTVTTTAVTTTAASVTGVTSTTTVTTTAATTGAGAGGAGGMGGSGGGPGGCGDGMIDTGEDCDVTVGAATCTSVSPNFTGGILGCNADCTHDTSNCIAAANCGNGAIEGTEECDMAALNSQTCATQGFATGTLGCTNGCIFDTSACWTCGDGNVTGNEVCDGMNLNGQSCVTQNFDAGTLLCAGNCLSYNSSSCTNCGDGLAEGTEACDMADLNGSTCMSLGFAGGTLSCDAMCAYNTSQCSNSQCSDLADNDGDGFTDLADPGCTNAADNNEQIFLDNCSGVGGPVFDVTFANLLSDITITANTTGIPSAYNPTDFTGDCSAGEGSGGEIVMMYRVGANPLNGVNFFFSNTNFDTMLYVREASCSPGAVEVCNDDANLSVQSEITMNLAANTDYYIVVDGWNAGAAGPFELNIDLPN